MTHGVKPNFASERVDFSFTAHMRKLFTDCPQLLHDVSKSEPTPSVALAPLTWNLTSTFFQPRHTPVFWRSICAMPVTIFFIRVLGVLFIALLFVRAPLIAQALVWVALVGVLAMLFEAMGLLARVLDFLGRPLPGPAKR